MVVGEEGTNGGLWCSPVANTSSPTSSVFRAMATIALIRSCSPGVAWVVGSGGTSPTLKIPNCTAAPFRRGLTHQPAHPTRVPAGLFPRWSGRCLAPHPGPPLRRPARYQPGRVVVVPPAGRGTYPAGGDRPAGRGDRGPGRPHLRGQPAPPLPRPGGYHPGRVPAVSAAA